MTSSNLMELPAELRVKIWKLVMPTKEEMICCDCVSGVPLEYSRECGRREYGFG